MELMNDWLIDWLIDFDWFIWFNRLIESLAIPAKAKRATSEDSDDDDLYDKLDNIKAGIGDLIGWTRVHGFTSLLIAGKSESRKASVSTPKFVIESVNSKKDASEDIYAKVTAYRDRLSLLLIALSVSFRS